HAAAHLHRAQPVQPDDPHRPRSEGRSGEPLSGVPPEDDRSAVHGICTGLERGPAHLRLQPEEQGRQGHELTHPRSNAGPAPRDPGEERMTGGFNANVPARKPRTQIGRVLTELTAEAEAREKVRAADAAALDSSVSAESTTADGALTQPATNGPARTRTGARGTDSGLDAAAEATPEEPVAPTSRTAEGGTAERNGLAAPSPGAPNHTTAAEAAHPAGPSASVRESTRLAAGRERVAALRERLAVAARPPVAGAEPKRTAAAVLEVVQDLRARLEAVIQERSAVSDTLEETRAMLARTQADLEKERKLRAMVEERGEERARI